MNGFNYPCIQLLNAILVKGRTVEGVIGKQATKGVPLGVTSCPGSLLSLLCQTLPSMMN